MSQPSAPDSVHALTGKNRASVTEVLEARARRDGERPFLVEDGLTVSYREAWQRSLRVAGFLASCGIGGQEQRVASFLSKRSEALWCWFGPQVLHAVPACLNWEHRGELLLDMIDRTGARLLFTESGGWEHLPELDGTAVDTVVFIDRIPDAATKGAPKFGLQLVTFEDVLSHEPPAFEHPGPADIASLIYSSGSTGRSKAVLIPHNLFTRGGARLAESMDLGEDDVVHDTSPLYHIAGQLHTTSLAMAAGASLAIFPWFSRSRFFEQVRSTGATTMGGFANLIRYLMSEPPADSDRDHGLRYAMIAQTRPGEAAAFSERFGVTVVDSYGMTEGEPLTLPDPGSMPESACGKVNPDFDIAILDENGNRLPMGENGRIAFRPNVPDVMMRGYAGDPEATVAAWRDLWFHTQDIGRLDDAGYLYFADRLKFTIRRRGENIIPADVENAIRAHPSVEDCVAIGVPDGAGDYDVRVYAARVPGTQVGQDELIEWSAGRVARFMVPSSVVVADTLPYTPAGKIDRSRLAELD